MVYDPVHDAADSSESNPATTHPEASAENPEPKKYNFAKYTRHIKKPDGYPFTRNDIQYDFMKALLSDPQCVFSNPFKNNPDNMAVLQMMNQHTLPQDPATNHPFSRDTYNATQFINNDKLTFAQLYILTICSPTKNSKLLRERILTDADIALATVVIALLLNFGKLNTTINFFLGMRSGLRTFHTIPSLQVHFSDLNHSERSLQDTPRLKSILKAIPYNQEEQSLKMEHSDSKPPNVVNLIFLLCSKEYFVNENFMCFARTEKLSCWAAYKASCYEHSLYELFDSHALTPESRARFFLWLCYLQLETDLNDEDFLQNPFNVDGLPPPLKDCGPEFDIDLPEEVAYGEKKLEERREFLVSPVGSNEKKNGHHSLLRKSREHCDSEDEEDEIIGSEKLKDAVLEARTLMNHKRHFLGFPKMFLENDDVCLAKVVRAKSKKRRSFKDPISEFETSMFGIIGQGRNKLAQLAMEKHSGPKIVVTEKGVALDL